MIDLEFTIDWFSVKMNGAAVFICAISGQQILYWLGGLATITTIVYNLIRIYKELKYPKQENKKTIL